MFEIIKKTDKNYSGNMYVILCDNNFLIVDPCINFLEVKDILKDKTCSGVFLTHAHFDHFCEIESYIEKGFNIFLAKEAIAKLQNPEDNASHAFNVEKCITIPEKQMRPVKEDDTILIGEEKAKVLSLAGHTDCSLGLIVRNHFFCGDFIFEGGNIGRYDLATGSGMAMRQSLRRLKDMDKNLTIHSGHGNDFLLKDY